LNNNSDGYSFSEKNQVITQRFIFMLQKAPGSCSADEKNEETFLCRHKCRFISGRKDWDKWTRLRFDSLREVLTLPVTFFSNLCVAIIKP